MSIRISPLRRNDLKRWIKYHYKYYDEIKTEWDFGLLLYSKKPSPSKLSEEFYKMHKEMIDGDSIIFIAEDDNKIVGECRITRQSRGRGEDHSGILSIAINKDYRNKGIGYSLMKVCIAKAKRKFDIVTLYVFKQNKKAIRLYRKFGFVKTGMWPKAIKRNGKYIDDIIMQLDFKKS